MFFFRFSCVFVGRHLGFRVLAAFGRSWSCLGRHLITFWTLGRALGGPWGTLGPLSGRSWTLLGRSWGLLESSCTDLELQLKVISFWGLNLRPKMEASWHQNSLKMTFRNQCDFTPRFSSFLTYFSSFLASNLLSFFKAPCDSCTNRGFCENKRFP